MEEMREREKEEKEKKGRKKERKEKKEMKESEEEMGGGQLFPPYFFGIRRTKEQACSRSKR